VAWGIIQGRGIIRVLKFERVVGYLREGNYCFSSSVAGGIIRGRGIHRVNTVRGKPMSLIGRLLLKIEPKLI